MSVAQEIGHHAAEIRLENIGKSFGTFKAVSHINLHIRKGDFFTFLGPSGCGKTTLLRMIAGFLRPDEGVIRFDGRPINHIPPWRRDVGMVFQNLALWPHMSVFDTIAFGLRERNRPRDEIREKVLTALKLVDLEGTENRRPSQLSGGQQQRVALARTLVIEPRALLLDEPLSSLDAKLRIQMRGELIRIQRDLGITTIYVTHDQEEALALSTRVAVFSRGRVVQEGSPREIYEAPHAAHVARFVGTSNLLPATVVRTDETDVYLNAPDAENLRINWKDSLEHPPEPGQTLTAVIRPESIRIVSSPPEENRIEGRVRSSVYLGAQIQYDIETPAGTTFKIDIPNPRRAPAPAPNQQVILTFSPREAVLLTDPPDRPEEP